MTSQIVLMNGFGVAIASDSAVTMGDQSRTYETAEKIIRLPSPHRIAVLHSGSVSVGNIPYSVLLAEWARQMPEKPLRSADAYQSHFIDWLSTNPQWFGKLFEEGIVFRATDNRASVLANQLQRNSESPEFSPVQLLDTWIEDLKNARSQEGISMSGAVRVIERHQEMCDAIFDDHLPQMEEDQEVRAKFNEYLARYLVCDWLYEASTVFVGYGEREILPSWTRVDITGFVDGRLLWSPGGSHTFGPDTNPLYSICLPAQRDAIDQYLRGYEYRLTNTLSRPAVEAISKRLSESLADKGFSETQLSEILTEVEESEAEARDAINSYVKEYSDEQYVDKLSWAIAVLPPASLVDVARSLIEIQALRQTTTAQLSTVGGPIDVALITPDEGFQWVRHKSIG